MSRKGANNKRCQRRRGLKIGRDCFLKGPGALRTSYRHTLSFAQVQLVPNSYLLLNEPPPASPCWTWTPSPNNLVSRDRGPPLPSSWHTRQTFSQQLALQRLHTWNERPRHSTRLAHMNETMLSAAAWEHSRHNVQYRQGHQSDIKHKRPHGLARSRLKQSWNFTGPLPAW